MCIIHTVTPAEIVRRLERDGWVLARTKGSHRQYRKGSTLVTVAVHRGDIPIGTLRNIFRQAGWKWPPH